MPRALLLEDPFPWADSHSPHRLWDPMCSWNSLGQGKVYAHPLLTLSCPSWQGLGLPFPTRSQAELCAALPLWLQARPGCGQLGKGLLGHRQGWQHRAVHGWDLQSQDHFGITPGPSLDSCPLALPACKCHLWHETVPDSSCVPVPALAQGIQPGSDTSRERLG